MTGNKLQDLVKRTIQNIEEDRSVANKLLTDLVIYMAKTGDSSHQSVGHLAAQYLETLQRSNEQLVKLTGILQRQEGGSKAISEMERNSIYESIRGDK